jgi:hypothetical protein
MAQRQKPTHYLQQLGERRAPSAIWAELLAIQGWDVSRVDDTRSTVHLGGIVVAEIVGSESATIRLIPDGVAKADSLMGIITEVQRAASEQVMWKIDRDAIAVHEAGHAVAAHTLNRKFCYVRISTTANEMAWCKDDGPDALHDSGDFSAASYVQQVLAAGVAAEQIIFGRFRQDGAIEDRRTVNDVECFKPPVGPEGPPTNHPDVFDDYVALVTGELTADKISAVADALKEKEFLSRNEVGSIIEGLEL